MDESVQTQAELRGRIAAANRIVVKIGSSAVADLEAGLDRSRLDKLVDALESRATNTTQVVVVSSGAIGSGIAPLGLRKRPTDVATKQAAASVGQLELAYAWGQSFRRYGRVVGQVLLTPHDFALRTHTKNAQRTLERLCQLGAIPIINENDTVATNELRFGDNDRLAAMVAHLTGADALILLSDVDGLYDGDPRSGDARLIPYVSGSQSLAGVNAGDGGVLGTGGMASKVTAAMLASDAGVPVLLTAADQASQALRHSAIGTVFAPRDKRMSARRFWVRHAAEVQGSIVIDEGAIAAVVDRRRSLLPAGIIDVDGGFLGGDVVDVVDMHGRVVGRGVTSYDASELVALIGHSTSDLPSDMRRPVIHADDLVRVH